MNNLVQRSNRFIILSVILGTACIAQNSNISYPSPYPSNPVGAQATQLQDSQTPERVDLTIPLQSIPPPETGKASIGGTLYSFTLSRVIPKTLLYLTMASGKDNRDWPSILIGPEPTQGDIVVTSNEEGLFFVNNIPPGNYFLVVATPIRWSLAVVPDRDYAPLLIELKPDQRQPLGIVYVPWP